LDQESSIDDDLQEPFPVQPTTSIDLDGHQPIQLFIHNGTPHVVTIHIHQQAATPASGHSEEHGIIDDSRTNTSGQERPSGIEEIVKRRELFQEGLRTGAAILTTYDLINNELVDRFLTSFKKAIHHR